MMTSRHLCQVMTLIVAGLCLVKADTCYNSTIHATSNFRDVTVFKAMETIDCEDGFGCSKTLITKTGRTIGVSRGCGLFGCLGKSCFLLHGHRLCVYCCNLPNCNRASSVSSNLTVLVLLLVAGWMIRKH